MLLRSSDARKVAATYLQYASRGSWLFPGIIWLWDSYEIISVYDITVIWKERKGKEVSGFADYCKPISPLHLYFRNIK